MQKFYTLLSAVAVVLLAASCTTSPNSGFSTEPIDVAVTETVRNDKVIGTWRGIIPCADCPGINYNLTLNDDNSFEETLIYQGRSAQPFTQQGTWRVNNGVVELDNRMEERSRFSLSDSELLVLDKASGRPITTGSSSMNRLRKDESLAGVGVAQWGDSQKRGVDFVGQGSNPGWVLEIDQEKSISFRTRPSEEISVNALVPKATVSENIMRYSVKTENGVLEVELVKSSCTDAMSGAVSAYTVKVSINGKTFNGCGLYLGADTEKE